MDFRERYSIDGKVKRRTIPLSNFREYIVLQPAAEHLTFHTHLLIFVVLPLLEANTIDLDFLCARNSRCRMIQPKYDQL